MGREEQGVGAISGLLVLFCSWEQDSQKYMTIKMSLRRCKIAPAFYMQAVRCRATGNLCGVESVHQIRRGREEQGVGVVSGLLGLFCSWKQDSQKCMIIKASQR